jgi:hypothetical protein
MPEFGWLEPSGEYHRQGNIDQNDIRKCPHFIMVWEHYRGDGSCRCDDITHTEMRDWGYTWRMEYGKWM